MSLKDGGAGVRGILLLRFAKNLPAAVGKWESWFWISSFPAVAVEAVGMWESRSDSQGRWETMENPLLVFLVFHGPSFP
jgi:hypothetical protein